MRKRIFITGCCFRAPGLNDFAEIIAAMDNPGFRAAFGEMALSDERKTFVARLDLDKTSPHYPSGSSLKVLRSDVIAALICSGELLEQAGLTATELLDVPLYIANGSSFDLSMEQLAEITTAYLPQAPDESPANRYQRINAALPPMYVLRTLANATECFVAQKTGAKGDNATFGLSSHSTHYALLEGMRRIENSEAEMALVGASNGIGIFSALIVGNFNQAGFEWRESEGAGILLLESGASASRSGRRPLAEIVSIHSGKSIPDIFSDRPAAPPYQDFHHDLADFCLYSGGLSRDDHRREEEACKGKWQKTFSWFDQLGITGSNAILLNVATAIALFGKGRADQVDCVNRDSFGRESFLKLKAVES